MYDAQAELKDFLENARVRFGERLKEIEKTLAQVPIQID